MSYIYPEKRALWLDIQDILNNPTTMTRMVMSVTIHTPTESFDALKLMTMDVYRDYVNKVADVTTISMKLSMGDYVYRVYPNRNKLEISIRIISLKSVSQERVMEEPIFIDKYDTKLDPSCLPRIQMSDYEQIDIETLNATEMVDLTIPLFEKSIVKSKVVTVQGVHSGTVSSVIESVLKSGSVDVDGVQMVPADNTESKKHIIFSEGVHLTAVPTYLQQKMGGVYDHSIGNYLQRYNNKKNWYVYPLYKTDRFNGSDERVIFYGIPEDKYLEAENTYKKVGSTLKVVVAGQKQFFDNSDISYLEDGAGFTRTKAEPFLKKPVEISNGQVIGSADSLNQQWDVDDDKNELKYRRRASAAISVNPYHEKSTYMQKKASRIDFNWNNSRADLIYPGMPCKYVYMTPEGISEYLGVILSVHQYTSLQGNPSSSTTYKSTCAITVAISRYDTGLKADNNIVQRSV